MAAVMNLRDTPAPVETLDTLTARWAEAKKRESDANAERVALEEAILALQPTPEEGSQTVKLANGFKLTITGKLSYKVADLVYLQELCESIPEAVRPIQKKVVADETGLKWLRHNEPEMWRTIAPAVEVKPAKTAIKVAL